ncbi:hypothetical protein C8Q76DRAFT_771266 [Earliella scabrosa]|nr:hypothetical protein C8Q76DRAFT_771266 [Earliella scabrosa]
MNVLVYTGPDSSPTYLSSTTASLRSLLVPNYAVQTVTSQTLASHPWAATCALLVLPSFLPSTGATPAASAGANTGTVLSSAAAKEIQTYVASGGRLLTLGTSVRVSSRPTATALSLSAQIAGLSIADSTSRTVQGSTGAKLTLEDPDLRLSFSLIPAVPEDADHAIDSIEGVDGARIEGLLPAGPIDLATIPESHQLKILARSGTDSGTSSAAIAGIQARIGRGAAAFWSVQLGAPLTSNKDDRERVKLLRQTLEALGLRLPAHGDATETPPRPTPQIFSAAPWRSGVVERILSALGVPALSENEPYELKDSNDTFLLHAHATASRVFTEQREAAAQLSDDPATWNPKHIVVYTDGALPPSESTPRFDITKYYDELAKARAERGCPGSYSSSQGEDAWGAGEALLYGEIVTSTQTMLDKNQRLLTSLPTPLLSLASSQLTGRGRGANIWLSPPGCLQFSLLLRVSLAAFPASKIVFVQYLVALAVAEACRAPGVLGAEGERVRIKWPNDIYVVARDGEKKKVGGILVNTSFGAGKVEIVIGCGLNVLNPPPIMSLAQLSPDSPESASKPQSPTMEGTLAAIMARFERMWAEFVRERGSFAPFMDLYLERWLHSDQLVTLTTVTPARKVRIVGITPDYGLLRTLPERDSSSAWGGGVGVEYIDLQPDGNSFDLMAGLIKTKT